MSSSPAHRAFRPGRWCPVALAIGLCGCARTHPAPAPGESAPLAVQVYADTAHGAGPATVAVALPVSVWLERVGPVRPAPLDLPPPDAPADTVIPESPPAAEIERGLTPPVLIEAVPLATPRDRRGGQVRGSVELDVQVDEAGAVAQTVWAGGSADSALVQAAVACARAMRFHPARRGDLPISVWCRQRFDFGAAGRR